MVQLEGFGPAKMQHAINHWEHFNVKHFEKVCLFTTGQPLPRQRIGTWVHRVLFPVIIAGMLTTEILTKKQIKL